MKRWQALFMVVSMPLMLLGVVWQAGRQASLVAEARELERQQESWVEANAKLIGGISVLENRERANELASKLGLERATAERRIFIETEPSRGSAGTSASSPSQAVKSNG